MKKLLLSFVVLLVAGSVFTACGPTQDDAIEYNDRLVRLYDQAHELDKELDKAFMDKFSSFIDNPENFEAFAEEYSEKYDKLIAEIDAVPDLEEHNQMKKELLALVKYMKNSLETYYRPILNDPPGQDSKEEEIVKNYNQGYEEREKAFEKAQLALADEFYIELVEKK